MTLLNSDPDYQARTAAHEAARQARRQLLAADELSLVEDLAVVGWPVHSVWDLVNTTQSYPAAIPVLINHLSMDHLARTREGIARALTVKEARGIATRAVLEAFRRSTSLQEAELRWTLANTLTVIADPTIRGELQQMYDSGQYPNEAQELKSALRRASRKR